MDSFLNPLQSGLGLYLGRFFDGIIPMTKAMEEFCGRDQSDAMAFASGRMVDEAEKMLRQWIEEDFDGPETGGQLPAIIVALDPEVIPTGRDFTRQLSSPEYVRLSDDDARVFQLRTMTIDQRLQIAIAAHDVTTAKSIASQLLLFVDDQRRFTSVYQFAGHDLPWEVFIDTVDSPASKIPLESKNLTLLAVDLTVKATIPLYRAPGEGEPHDGSVELPHGYPVVLETINQGAM